MEQDDEEFEKLLGEIPRATSAPPHLEELQRTLGTQSEDGAFLSGKEETMKPFTDIRSDELYEDFYRSYSGSKKLPPPMENRSIYNDLSVVSPKSSSNQLSPFYSGLTLDSPRTSFRLRQMEMHQKQQPQMHSQQSPHQQPSVPNLVNQLSNSPSHQLLCDDQSLSSAFSNLNFSDASILEAGAQAHRANGRSSNEALGHGAVAGLSSDLSAVVSSGLYSHLNVKGPFSSGYASANGSLSDPLVSGSLSSLDLFSRNASAIKEARSNGFHNGLDESPSVTVGQVMEKLRQGSPSMDLPSNGLCPLGAHDADFLSNHQLEQQQQQNFDVYSAAMAASALQVGRPYSNKTVSPSELFAPSINREMQYPFDREIISFIQAQQRIEQAAVAARVQQQVEEERLRYRQRMQQQLLLRQQQLQEQQACFYATLRSQPASLESTYSRLQSLIPTDQQSTLNSPFSFDFFQPEPLPKQRHVGGLGYGGLWTHQQTQGSLAAASTGLVDPSGMPRSGNICRYYAQGFCSRGETCPFLHLQPHAGKLPQSINGGSVASPRETVNPEKNHGKKSAAVSSVSSGGKRKDLVTYDHSNGHIQGSSNHLSSQGHPANYHEDDRASTKSSCQDNLDLESLRPVNVQQQPPKYTTLEEVEGHIYAIAKDQHGCRFLQRKFEERAVEDVQKIFLEIIDHIIELMTDPFGNYLIQKLLEVCDEAQRMEILQKVTGKGQLVTISLNMHGTRAVQKLVETLKSPEQILMAISSLTQGVVTLIKDLNGNHVVQRCLQRLSNDDNQFIFDAAASHCVEIATHRHGCCVLQRCVDFASGAQRQRLVAEIAANALVLARDPFGNYVVQYILDLEMPWATLEVIVRLEGNYVYLAMQKFSSNVVEKCLKLAAEENKSLIIRELIASSHLGQLLQDPYANYVVQSALTVSKGALHTGLVEAIRPHLPALRNSPYGKRILSRTNLKK